MRFRNGSGDHRSEKAGLLSRPAHASTPGTNCLALKRLSARINRCINESAARGDSRMLKALVSVVLAVGATDALAASNQTDFGIRPVAGTLAAEPAVSSPAGAPVALRSAIDIRSVAGLGSQWGRVTSTYRSPEHNRRVGGVRNSWHMRGRAVDIARRPGVTHSQIAAAYRNAGYHLIESLDEGDHSHFAFGSGSSYARRYLLPARSVERASATASNATQWRIVTASSAVFK